VPYWSTISVKVVLEFGTIPPVKSVKHVSFLLSKFCPQASHRVVRKWPNPQLYWSNVKWQLEAAEIALATFFENIGKHRKMKRDEKKLEEKILEGKEGNPGEERINL
jgi:hypothetical protein